MSPLVKSVKKRISRLGASSFGKDVLFTAGGQVAVMLLALIVNKLMTAYLAPADYTIFSIANKGASVLAFVMLLGLGIALPRYIARFRAHSDLRGEMNFVYASCGIFLVTTAVVSVAIVVFKDFFAQIIFNDQAHAGLVVPMIIFAFGVAASTFLYSYLRGIDKFKEYSLAQIIVSIVGVAIVIICGANIGLHLQARGVVSVMLSFIGVAALLWVSYKTLQLDRKLIFKNIKTIFLYCLPRVPGEFFLFAFTVIPLVIINTRFGSEPAAAFAIAITLNMAIVPVFQFVGTVLLPYVSKNLAKGNTKDISTMVNKLRKLYLILGIGSILPVVFFTDPIIRLLFSAEYTVYADTVRIVYLSVVPYALYLLLRNPIDAVSVIPFNTFNLGASLLLLALATLVSPSLLICAVAFPVSYLLLGLLSEVTWRIQLKRASRAHKGHKDGHKDVPSKIKK